MAFVATDLGMTSVSVSNDVLVQAFNYVTAVDNIAAILDAAAPGYFVDADDVGDVRLKNGDVIYVQTTDSNTFVRVTDAANGIAAEQLKAGATAVAFA